ncbi:hypothetical protein NQ317_003854 [Molorchus minor]|uniref:Uncharacterized protein n=1 Tax=Molorchus minor TaxID=1323400 RepID=A0ABQ9J2H4_9CUCU|nr:hypothetical protein NQ317_003854 [Molorchus minor]
MTILIQKICGNETFFPNNDEFVIMRHKGVFPYSFVDSLEKLDYPTLPPKEQLYDKLNKVHIADEEYERAKTVWNIFACRSLGDYSDLYLKTDVLLLCDTPLTCMATGTTDRWISLVTH